MGAQNHHVISMRTPRFTCSWVLKSPHQNYPQIKIGDQESPLNTWPNDSNNLNKPYRDWDIQVSHKIYCYVPNMCDKWIF